MARELRKVISVVRKEVTSGTLRHDIAMVDGEDTERCVVVDVSVVTIPRGDWVVPTAEEAAASIDEAAKATGGDGGKPGNHKVIEISRMLCNIGLGHWIPKSEHGRKGTRSTRTLSYRGSSQHGI